MANSSTRSGADAPETADDDVSLTYHRSGDGDQVVIGIESEGVHLSVAFDEGTSRARLDDALAAQRRELDHYYATTTASR